MMARVIEDDHIYRGMCHVLIQQGYRDALVMPWGIKPLLAAL